MTYTAHVDSFARDHLPPRELWPEFIFELPALGFSERMNAASELLRGAIDRGHGDRVAIRAPGGFRWTYAELDATANRIARVLVEEAWLRR